MFTVCVTFPGRFWFLLELQCIVFQCFVNETSCTESHVLLPTAETLRPAAWICVCDCCCFIFSCDSCTTNRWQRLWHGHLTFFQSSLYSFSCLTVMVCIVSGCKKHLFRLLFSLLIAHLPFSPSLPTSGLSSPSVFSTELFLVHDSPYPPHHIENTEFFIKAL